MRGKTAAFHVRRSSAASDVAKYVFENWPEGECESTSAGTLSTVHPQLDWADEPKVDRYEVLRLIYQGRFLHGNVTLSALHLQQGESLGARLPLHVYPLF